MSASQNGLRVVIVDVAHLFYKYAFGGAPPLSASILVDGVPQIVDTTLPTYVIKQIHRWSYFGAYPTVVCFDGKGSTASRKAYFLKNSAGSGSPVNYKEGRKFQDKRFYEGINITGNLLSAGGVLILKKDGFEADDLIKVTVDRAKIQYPGVPIDVITGDTDLVPLVDDQVSVFLTSRKTTWAERPELEKRGYVQITPINYQSYIEGLSDNKKLFLPYNTLLLKKLLRGDKTDEIPGYPKFTPTKFNNLVGSLVEDGYDLGDIFRYDAHIKRVVYRGIGTEIPPEELDSVPEDQREYRYDDPPALTKMCDILSGYLDDDIIQHIRFVYRGINLNAAYLDLPTQLQRRPCMLTKDIHKYSAGALQHAVNCVHIQLPV